MRSEGRQMNGDSTRRLAAEATGHTTSGFFQGIGWTLGGIVAYTLVAALTALTTMASRHFTPMAVGIVAVVALHIWRRLKRRQRRQLHDRVPSLEPTPTARHSTTLFQKPATRSVA